MLHQTLNQPLRYNLQCPKKGSCEYPLIAATKQAITTDTC
jgi:hypothetical protein